MSEPISIRETHHGIGRVLLAQLAATARAEGRARIDWIVATDDERGQSFYRGMGASVNEEVRHCRLDADAIAALAGV